MRINIENLGMNGEGVGKVDGKIALTNFTLPGESAEIEIVKDFKNYSLARATKILNKSSERVNPPCKYFYLCGGCALQHMSYSLQLKFKTNLVKNTIKKITGIDCNVENTVLSNQQYNYRNKASFNYQGGHSGFYKNNSHEIVDINQCNICSKTINDVYCAFNDYIKSHSVEAYVKHLVVREINGQILIGVVTNTYININTLYNTLLNNLNLKNKKIGIYQIVNTRKDSVVF